MTWCLENSRSLMFEKGLHPAHVLIQVRCIHQAKAGVSRRKNPWGRSWV